MSRWQENHVPQLRLHKSTGQAVVTLSGRDIYLGKHGTKEARAAYDKLKSEWEARGRSMPGSDLSVSEIVATFIDHATTYYGRESGELRNYRFAMRPLVALYGDSSAASFGPIALECVRNRMVEIGWSRRHVNQEVGRVVRVFKWAASRELLPASVPQALATLDGLKRGRSAAKERPPVRAVADAIVDATLPHLPPVVAGMVSVQRLCGARPSEICTMTTGAIDRDGAIWVYRPATHKNLWRDETREIYIGPRAQEILRPFLKLLNPVAFLFDPRDATAWMRQRRAEARKTPATYGNVVGSNRVKSPKRLPGKCYDHGSYRVAVHRACDKAGVARWNPNQLRHLSGTRIRREFGLEHAGAILGHKDLDTTQIYAERSAQTARQVAEKIG